MLNLDRVPEKHKAVALAFLEGKTIQRMYYVGDRTIDYVGWEIDTNPTFSIHHSYRVMENDDVTHMTS